ncbi:hypothetical protein PT974_09277 [Cladobotryum mycophilum]|uniref:Uncharacterized protein n=1 Tax=Cladobotryum mycophilum TaxID=491253 RepID=A0ABR0SFN9_9HYPO
MATIFKARTASHLQADQSALVDALDGARICPLHWLQNACPSHWSRHPCLPFRCMAASLWLDRCNFKHSRTAGMLVVALKPKFRDQGTMHLMFDVKHGLPNVNVALRIGRESLATNHMQPYLQALSKWTNASGVRGCPQWRLQDAENRSSLGTRLPLATKDLHRADYPPKAPCNLRTICATRIPKHDLDTRLRQPFKRSHTISFKSIDDSIEQTFRRI